MPVLTKLNNSHAEFHKSGRTVVTFPVSHIARIVRIMVQIMISISTTVPSAAASATEVVHVV